MSIIKHPPFTDSLQSLTLSILPRLDSLATHTYPILESITISRRPYISNVLMVMEDVVPSQLPALRKLQLSHCFIPWPLASGLFSALTELIIALDPGGLRSASAPKFIPALAFQDFIEKIPNIVHLTLQEAFPWPIKPPFSAETPYISLPSSLQSIYFAFLKRTRLCIPFIKSIVVSPSVSFGIRFGAKQRWVQALTTFILASRPHPRSVRLRMKEVEDDLSLFWFLVTLSPKPLGPIAAKPEARETDLGCSAFTTPPFSGLPLDRIETLLLHAVHCSKELLTFSDEWWATTLSHAQNVRTLELTIDRDWFSPVMRALAGCVRMHPEQPILPRLHTLVLIDPEPSIRSVHTQMKDITSLRRLDVIRWCLVARADAGVSVHALALPFRFKGISWAEDLRYHVDKLFFGKDLCDAQWIE
ncbi:hypothetical protein K488DRAFT_85191 [Vararia minispora EC-137]|uniref:Uncharacterized protein n=1 Tax=Vararia minispora EC-137 TaxID=1314806 RepID=A0ACB8QMN1_9AGAM|nr:hypothetical protein K488DRAFT_85191 [Vararia minispora EC-137]